MGDRENLHRDIPQSSFCSLWNTFSIFTGILGLASLVEELAKWQGYIAMVVSSYQNITHPLFEYLFSWMPFNVPNLVGDYILLGLIVVGCFLKAKYEADQVCLLGGTKIRGPRFTEYLKLIIKPKTPLRDKLLFDKAIYIIMSFRMMVWPVLTRLLFWPIIFLYHTFSLIKGFDREKREAQLREKHHSEIGEAELLALIKDLEDKGVPASDIIEVTAMVDAIPEFKKYLESLRFIQWISFTVFGLLLLFTFNQLT